MRSQSKTVIILAHIAGWLLLYTLIMVFVSYSPGASDAFSQTLTIRYLAFFAVYIFLFYFNSLALVPYFLLQKKYAYYFIIIIILFIGIYFLKPYDRFLLHTGPEPIQPRPPGPEMMEGPPLGNHVAGPGIDIISLILFLTVWSLSTAICIVRQWQITQQKAIKAETEKANAELSFLKAQINPHFLFNTLNNLYTLAITKNEKTAESIMKFSNIMRYVTDELASDMVPLQNEIDCIHDYIDLQQLRLNDKTKVDLDVSGDCSQKNIAPLLLMTFVENVFKYGVSSRESSEIIIRIISKEESIFFFCQNKIFNTPGNVERTGIGIRNVKKRLEYLYPDRHSLNINQRNGLYTVELTLLT